jgi:hypothetical protein
MFCKIGKKTKKQERNTLLKNMIIRLCAGNHFAVFFLAFLNEIRNLLS